MTSEPAVWQRWFWGQPWDVTKVSDGRVEMRSQGGFTVVVDADYLQRAGRLLGMNT